MISQDKWISQSLMIFSLSFPSIFSKSDSTFILRHLLSLFLSGHRDRVSPELHQLCLDAELRQAFQMMQSPCCDWAGFLIMNPLHNLRVAKLLLGKRLVKFEADLARKWYLSRYRLDFLKPRESSY